MIYFRTYAKELGCPVDELGDLAVWNFILRHQDKPELVPGEITHHFETEEFKKEWR